MKALSAVTLARNLGILAAYTLGEETLQDIGARYGMSREWVRRIVKEMGAPRRIRYLARNQKIRAEYEAGLPLGEIAERYGLSSKGRVGDIAFRMGATPRPPTSRHGGTTRALVQHCPCEICRASVLERGRVQANSRKARGLAPGDPRHGTVNGYGNWHCRCPLCTAAWTRHMHERYMFWKAHPEKAPPSTHRRRPRRPASGNPPESSYTVSHGVHPLPGKGEPDG